ncbi:DUF4340 domain-containing protein [Persicobacter diffluens]
MRTNTQLLIILIGLLVWFVVSISVDFSDRQKFTDLNAFTIADTAAIRSIEITNQQEVTLLNRQKDGWLVNELPAESGMIDVLLSILNQMEVKRRVPKREQESVYRLLTENGIKVKVTSGEGSSEFITVGNPAKTLSYFQKEDDVPAIVHLPGYNSYVTGIFEVLPNDWRKRAIFESSPRSLKSLQLQYPEHPEDNFEITSNSIKWEIEGLPEGDQKLLNQYLSQFAYLQVDQYLDRGQVKELDSLIASQPMAIITIDDIRKEHNGELKLFRTAKGEKMLAGLLNDEQIVLIEKKRAKALLAKRSDFLSE